MREKNLYGDLRRIDRIAEADTASFDNGGSTIVLDPAEVAAVASANPEEYRPQTAFFRTHARDPLPEDLRKDLRRDIIRLVNSEAAGSLTRTPRFDSGVFWTQGWGVEAVLDMLFPLICGRRDSALQQLTREYVKRVVVGSSVRGFRKRDRTRVSERIWGRMVPHLTDLPTDAHNDLVNVALRVRDRLTPRELPEVYSRMVLSMVGFTGIALEWAVMLGMQRTRDGERALDKFPSRAIVDESQRLAPAAWKLIREQSIQGAEECYRHVVLMTSAVHRSSRYWDRPLEFRPERWESPSTPTTPNFLPFGRGSLLCPARQFALDVLCSALDALRANYHVDLGPRRSLPRAHILFVPPRRRIRIGRAVPGVAGE